MGGGFCTVGVWPKNHPKIDNQPAEWVMHRDISQYDTTYTCHGTYFCLVGVWSITQHHRQVPRHMADSRSEHMFRNASEVIANRGMGGGLRCLADVSVHETQLLSLINFQSNHKVLSSNQPLLYFFLLKWSPLRISLRFTISISSHTQIYKKNRVNKWTIECAAKCSIKF